MSEDLRQHLDGNSGDEKLLAAIERLPLGSADVAIEAALARVKARRFEEPRRGGWSTVLKAAAIVGALLGGTLIWHTAINPDKSQVVASAHVFQTGIGETDSVSLPDGSKVILGPSSQLSLPAQYGKKGRSVELNGLAMFDVRHDASSTFTVRANGATIQDIGTTFFVRIIPQGVSVAVTKGSVSVDGHVLKKGDRAVRRSGGLAIQRGGVSAADFAWTSHQLVFQDATFDDVALELRRWYGIDVKADSALAKRHITGSFTGDSADRVLNVISLVLGARVERNGNTAIFRQR